MFYSSIPRTYTKSISIAFLLLLAILTACGTFEVGIESEETPESLDLAEGTASPTKTPEEQAGPTATAVRETQILTTVEASPEPNPLEIAFFWSGEMKGECQTLHINYGGEGAIGQCKTSARQWIPLDDRFAHAGFYQDWLERFAPFDAQTTPNGQVSLMGLGQEEASPAWQRAMGIWGELVWVELESEGRSESWTTAFEWRQQSTEQPNSCQSLQVSTYGRAQASLAPCQGGEPEAWVEAWLDDSEWEQFDAWYYSQAPRSEGGLSFYGIGPLDMAEADFEELSSWASAVFNRLILQDLLGSEQESGDEAASSVTAGTAIQMALIEATGIDAENLEFNISENVGTHAIGTLRHKDDVSGAYFIAANVDGRWTVVYHGQATPACADVELYQFPVDMVSECLDANENLVVRDEPGALGGDDEAIRAALIQATGIEAEELEFFVSENTGTHAQGMAKHKDEVAGAYFIAAKNDDAWVIAYHGHALPSCDQIAPYDFPVSMVPECLDALNRVVQR